MTNFIVLPRYTFKRDNNIWKTATVYKDGVEFGQMNENTAREFCWKWNGNREDCEIK
jgi:hypothetical protein